MPKSEKSVGQFWLDLFQASSDPNSIEQEDDMTPLGDYLKPKLKLLDELALQPVKNSVQFLNVKKCYEKVQRRQDGVSTQRPMDCNIRMLAKFDPAWGSRDIDVFVQRHPDSAKLHGDLSAKVNLEVRVGEKTDKMMYFSVDLDSVYRDNQSPSIYKLSTVDPLRRNKFILIVRLTSILRNQKQIFVSPTFLIRSRRPSKTITTEGKLTDKKDVVMEE